MSIDFDAWVAENALRDGEPEVQFSELNGVEWNSPRGVQELACKLVARGENQLEALDCRERFVVAVVDMGELDRIRPWTDELWAEVTGRHLHGAYLGLWWLDVPVFGTVVSEYYNRDLPAPLPRYNGIACVYHGFRGSDDFKEQIPTYYYSMLFLPRRGLPLGRHHA